ncbi:MAG TPA: hypothetical protein VHZ03_06130 [Trebonia sp.]|nr:hypothetical protein [Trebonia sp.]
MHVDALASPLDRLRLVVTPWTRAPCSARSQPQCGLGTALPDDLGQHRVVVQPDDLSGSPSARAASPTV